LKKSVVLGAGGDTNQVHGPAAACNGSEALEGELEREGGVAEATDVVLEASGAREGEAVALGQRVADLDRPLQRPEPGGKPEARHHHPKRARRGRAGRRRRGPGRRVHGFLSDRATIVGAEAVGPHPRQQQVRWFFVNEGHGVVGQVGQ
jgi:hypothetical protein